VRNSLSDENTSSISTFSGIKKIAVLVPTVKEDIPYRHIEGQFIQGLRAKGYTMMSRGDISSVMKEINFQKSGLTEGNAAMIGRILKADAILIVEITEYEKKRTKEGSDYIANVSMAARLIDVETSNIAWIKSKSTRNSLLVSLVMLPINILSGSNSKFDELTNSILSEFPRRS
jgi:hypothetical protein